MKFTTRFAPSPTGLLHLGHAYSALLAYDMARAANGQFLLRIEDTDLDRCKPQYEAAIYQDLEWLGLTWPQPILRQSEHLDRYEAVLQTLGERGLLYPCGCSRTDIRAAKSAPQEGQTHTVYPGTCRHRTLQSRRPTDALRLNLGAALKAMQDPVVFHDTGPVHPGTHSDGRAYLQKTIGDAVLGRKDIGAVSYVLAAVVDDAHQDITDVVRGTDLFEFTYLQVLLQRLLGLPTPNYHHHSLIRDEAGKRLAKRDDARAIARYRTDGATPQDIRHLVGL